MTAAPRATRAAFAFIFITVLLDVVALGIVIPVLPKLVESFVGGDTAQASIWVGVFSTAWGLMQFLFSPLIGALSDRFGRRPVVLASCFALAFDYFLMALAPSLLWLFVGRVISGIAAANHVAAAAYIADVTPAPERAAKFGLLGAAWGAGFVLGPALGGWLGSTDLRLPFWVAGAVALLNALYGLFVLPESLPKDQRSAFDPSKANPVSALKLISSYRGLLGLAFINFLYNVAHYVLPTVFALYASYRYGWTPATLGLTLAFVGVLNIAVQGGLVQPIVRAIGERRALYLGLIAGAIGFTWSGLASSGWWFVAGLVVFAFMGVFSPAIGAMMSHKMPATEQGRLQGFNASVTGIAGLLGPALFSSAFAWAISGAAPARLPGAAFFVAAALLLIGLVIALRTRD